MNTTRPLHALYDLLAIGLGAWFLFTAAPTVLHNSPWMHKHAHGGVTSTLVLAAADGTHALVTPIEKWWERKQNGPSPGFDSGPGGYVGGKIGGKVGNALNDYINNTIASHCPSC